MIRKLNMLIFNNYVGLMIGGALYQYKRQLIAVFLSYLVFMAVCVLVGQFIVFNFLYAVITLILVYFVILALSMLYWRYRSKKLGLRSLLIFPGAPFWLKKMLASRNIQVSIYGNLIEVHVNVRQKYKDWDDYNNAIDSDISTIMNHLLSGRFGKNVTVTFNSFNRQITDKLERAFTRHGHCVRFKKIALPNLAAYIYNPAHFKKVQIKMFGEVKSKRPVHVPEAWELLIHNHKSKGGKAV